MLNDIAGAVHGLGQTKSVAWSQGGSWASCAWCVPHLIFAVSEVSEALSFSETTMLLSAAGSCWSCCCSACDPLAFLITQQLQVIC